MCEIISQRFHQLGKRERSQSNGWNPAEYAIQRWRDAEQYSRVLPLPGEYEIPASWLTGRRGKQLKSVSFYSLGPSRPNATTVNDSWRAMHAVRTLLGSKADVWKRHALNAALTASPPMEPTVQPNGHVCATCGAVTGSPNAEPILSRSRLKLGLVWTSLAVGLFCGTPVLPQTRYIESP